MIPIKRADEASTGFVIYQYHKIQRAGDDNLRGKERLCLRFSADCILGIGKWNGKMELGIDKPHRQTFNSNLL